MRAAFTSLFLPVLLACCLLLPGLAGAQNASGNATAANATAEANATEANASETNASEPVPAEEIVEPEDVQVEVNATLLVLVDAMDNLRASIKEREKHLKSASTPSQRQEIEAEIDAMSQALRERQKNFEQVAAGVDLDALAEQHEESLDWSADLRELTTPILTELKKLTARPRDLERLRAEINRLNVLLPKLDSGLLRMQTLKQETKDKELAKRLTTYIDGWQEKRDGAASALSVAQLKLKEKLAEDSSIMSMMSRLFQSFFLTRGKNLISALGAAGLVFAIMRLAQGLLLRTGQGKRLAKRSTFFRAATVVYTFLCTLVAALVGLAILYNAGDWMLLGLTVLLLAGVLWSAKNSLASLSEQAKLLCNLGAVREGERIVYNGLPFKVGRINYYTTLVNPLLQGGQVRLRLEDLFSLTSRPIHAEEEWFPTHKGDFVLLSDGAFGKVVLQTPETVILDAYGGNRLHIPASVYLGLKPRNLTTGFGHLVVIGVDYSLQAQVLQEIPNLMEMDLRAGLEEAGYGPQLTNLFVQFKQAGESSLDLAVYAGFSGELASEYWGLQRLVARLATQSCTEHGWNIPFPQRTLHVVQPVDAKTS